MIHYNYSPEQLENKAEDLLKQFDEERLRKPKPIDVYAVIEKCLGVEYDWKYLTPDQSVYGMTAFKDGSIWAWPAPFYKEGMKPMRVFIKKGTIVIDSFLTEYEHRGPENFTVMHEVFHQVLHEKCFAHGNPDYHATTKQAISSKRRPMTDLEICEYQANACAAAFLMPRKVVADVLRDATRNTRMLDLSDHRSTGVIRQMAKDFSVSQKAMRYRLLNLKLAEE